MAHPVLRLTPAGLRHDAGHGVREVWRSARPSALALLIACSISISACRTGDPAGAQGLQPPIAPAKDSFPAPKPADRPTILKEATLKGLKPHITGPGIVICEPIAPKVPGVRTTPSRHSSAPSS